MILRTLVFALLVPVAAAAQEPPVFNRIATIEAVRMLPPDRDRTRHSIAEIVAASADGNTLIHVDGDQRGLGFVDITDPTMPRPAGFLPIEGDPTSVVVSGPRAFVVADTSPNKVAPSGILVVVDIATRRIEAQCELGGQPDSATVSRDGRFLVIVIENERNEQLNRGAMPQLPPATSPSVR